MNVIAEDMEQYLYLIALIGMTSKSLLVNSELVCPAMDGFFADVFDCCVFYRCVGGRPYTFSCPPGTYFDPVAQVCNWPLVVEDCNEEGRRIYYNDGGLYQRIDESVPVKSNSGPHYPDRGTSEFDNSRKSFLNLHYPDGSMPEPNPSDGHYIEPGNHHYPESESRAGPDSTFVCPNTDGFYPHKFDCKQFYRCVGKRPFHFACARGTFFDQSISVCNYPKRVPECESNGNRKFGMISIGGRSHGNSNNLAASKYGKDFSKGYLPCSQRNGLLPHPKSCSKFIYCNQYEGMLFECPRGLLFDRERHTCDFERKVLC